MEDTKIRFECPRDFLLECPMLERFAKCIAGHLNEEKVCIRRGWGYRCYIVCFEDSKSYFKIKNLHYDGNLIYGLELELLVNDEAIVTETFSRIEFYKFDNYMKNSALIGFVKPDRSLFKWESTRCELSAVAKRWSKYTDNDPAPGVVPDGITQVNVAALKHDGEVIAFRFETNHGYFDMDKPTAERWGISEVNVEDVIALHTVNGVLVAKLAPWKNMCIPDVSGCDEDCRKLADALLQVN